MCEAMLLPNCTITQQPMANSMGSPCKAGSTQLNTVNLRASTFRPSTLLKSPQARTHRTINRVIKQAAEGVAAPEVNAAQEPKKKIAIFVEPSPFSHVSGKSITSCWSFCMQLRGKLSARSLTAKVVLSQFSRHVH